MATLVESIVRPAWIRKIPVKWPVPSIDPILRPAIAPRLVEPPRASPCITLAVLSPRLLPCWRITEVIATHGRATITAVLKIVVFLPGRAPSSFVRGDVASRGRARFFAAFPRKPSSDRFQQSFAQTGISQQLIIIVFIAAPALGTPFSTQNEIQEHISQSVT
eukprot:jgi/Mesvir1/28201/Mv04754-RA.1